MSSKRLADTYGIANAFAKIGSNFLQIQSKNTEWFYKTSNWRWSVKCQKSPPQPQEIRFPETTLDSNIIADEPNTYEESNIRTQEHPNKENILKKSKIPTSRVSRLFHYGGKFRNLFISLNKFTHYYKFLELAIGLGAGAVGEAVRRATGISKTKGN
jgi:hypothetical protein